MARRRAFWRRGAGRDDLFRGLTLRGRIHLIACIFFTFAPMGVLLSMMRVSAPDPWWGVALWACFCGGIAVGWAMSFMWRMWLLPFVLVAQLLVPQLLGRAINVPWVVNTRLAALAATALALLVAGYVLFTAFVEREGARRMRLQAELDLARGIHETLAPPIDVRAGAVEVFGRSTPSSAMGGDLLDIVVEKGRVDVYLADVSGHGVRAGVVMGMLKSAIRMRLLAGGGLDTLLTDLNSVLIALLEPGMFATFACMRFHPGGEVEYALAGHLPILHFDAATGRLHELPNERLPLAVEGGEVFVSGRARSGPGDLFAVFTDGLTEVIGRGGREFGLGRVRGIVAADAGLPLRDLHEAVLGGVRAYGPQGDDQTLLLVRVGGS